jgi:hypothetical protein
LGRYESRFQVCGDSLVPIGFRDLIEISLPADRGVVHQDGNRSEFFLSANDHLANCGGLRDIRLEGDRATTTVPDLSTNGLRILRPFAIVHRDVYSGFRESDRNAGANAATRSRDQSNLSLQVVHRRWIGTVPGE